MYITHFTVHIPYYVQPFMCCLGYGLLWVQSNLPKRLQYRYMQIWWKQKQKMILFPGLDSLTNVWPTSSLCLIINLCLIFILIQECWQLTLEFTGELLFDGFFKKGWKLDITRGSLCIYIFKRHASTGNKGLFPFNMPWRYQVCIAKCLYSSSSHRDDLPEIWA